jgi:hypothetical protein
MVSKFFSKDDIGMNPNDIGIWINQYWDFLNFYRRQQSPLMINKEYMAKAQFHIEEGRGGYFAPESGTSEGQFLTIKGCLDIYLITKESKWLNLAIEMADASLKVLYRGKSIPEKFSEDNLWLPHWLFNASDEFAAEKYYLDKEVYFDNGVGKFTADYEAREVYTARSLDAQLEWQNPYSKVMGTEYKIANYSLDGKSVIITLDIKFTGKLKVVYADMGGETIEHNEPYEAWAIWRKLQDTEIACAIDSLWWSYDCYKLLSEITADPKWAKAYQNIKDTIPYAVDVSNMNDYLTTDMQNTDNPFFQAGTYQYQSKNPEATFTRSSRTGAMVIDIPDGEGIVQYGRGGLETEFSAERYIEARMQSNKTGIHSLIIATGKGYDEANRYTANFKLTASDTPQKLRFDRDDFIQTDNLLWDIFYLNGLSTWATYMSPSSSVDAITENEGGRDVLKVDFHVGSETNYEGFEYAGWSQFAPVWAETIPSIPPFKYKSTGEINIRLKDKEGWLWTKALPISESYTTLVTSPADYILSTFQEKTGTKPSSIAFPLQEILFDAIDAECSMHLMYVGAVRTMPSDAKIYDILFSFTSPVAQKLEIYYLRPLPAEDYTYVPYIAPFTINTLNNRIDGWRGTPYTGYQAPWVWQELDNPKGLDVVLDFMQAAQDEYEKNVGIRGFFMPVFIWDRWDSREYGTANSFTWNGPDPNTHWGGFQYRGIETVARTWHNDPTNAKAKQITMDFLHAVDELWDGHTTDIITTFPANEIPYGDYKEPHMAALLLRTCIFAYQATNNLDEEVMLLNLIKECVLYISNLYNPFSNSMKWNDNFVNGTWSVDNHSWYNFWGGEILSSLALLLQFTQSDFTMKTQYGTVEVETHPVFDDSISDFLQVKTPIGIQKVKLVSTGSNEASPFIVMTEKGEMAIGGMKKMDKNIKLLIKNEGNAMKKITSLHNPMTFPKQVDGLVKINSIKGMTLTNISPRESYDYAVNNWTNLFTGLKPNTTYNISFDVITTADTAMTLSLKDSTGTDYGWKDVDTMADAKRVFFGFTTGTDVASMMLYLQQDGATVQIGNILLLEGNYDVRPVPPYFAGSISSGMLAFDRSFEVNIIKDKAVIDSMKLTDIVSKQHLPLRSSGDVHDEIIDNILYKRIGSNNEILTTEEVIVLNKSITLLESHKGCTIELFDANNLFPELDIRYPMLLEDFITEYTQ